MKKIIEVIFGNLFVTLMLVALFMWHVNNMAHFNNIRNTVLDNNNKITKICIELKQCKEDNDY